MKTKILPLAMICAFAVAANQAVANDTVSATVNAKAGLSPVLSLTCSDVNFGVWRVPVRSAGGTTTISLDVSANTSAGATTPTVGGNTTNVAAASGYEVPEASICTVNGSNNVSSTIQTTIANNTGLSFGPSTHNNLKNPNTAAALTADLALKGAGVAIGATGSGTFRVIGVLTIPETIAEVNYGGYSTRSGGNDGEGNAATVTVTDALLIP
jgi:hypothetical protein